MPEEDNNQWESISDMMTGLMMVFLFISLAFLLEMKQVAQDYATTKDQLSLDLSQEFKPEELKRWGATIDKGTTSIRFQNPELLFQQGSDVLTPKFRNILDNFMPRYVALLRKPEYEGKILEVRIEGHTSEEWNAIVTRDESYLRNMGLSQRRAHSVLAYTFILGPMQNESIKLWLIDKVRANGLSFSQMVAKSGQVMPYSQLMEKNGQVNAEQSNAEQSRRVEFRVMTDAEKELQKIGGK